MFFSFHPFRAHFLIKARDLLVRGHPVQAEQIEPARALLGNDVLVALSNRLGQGAHVAHPLLEQLLAAVRESNELVDDAPAEQDARVHCALTELRLLRDVQSTDTLVCAPDTGFRAAPLVQDATVLAQKPPRHVPVLVIGRHPAQPAIVRILAAHKVAAQDLEPLALLELGQRPTEHDALNVLAHSGSRVLGQPIRDHEAEILIEFVQLLAVRVLDLGLAARPGELSVNVPLDDLHGLALIAAQISTLRGLGARYEHPILQLDALDLLLPLVVELGRNGFDGVARV